MTTTTHPAVTEYLARIQAALADLPAAEVEEIIDDIRQHLSEIAGELGEEISVAALTGRLGTPEQYASELRAAAGYPPPQAGPGARRGRPAARYALWTLVFSAAVTLIGGLAYVTIGSEVFGPVLVLLVPLYAALALVFTGRVRMSDVEALPEYRAVAGAGRRLVAGLPDRVVGYLVSLRPAWWLVRVVVLVAACLVAMQRQRGGQLVLALIALLILILVGARVRTDRRWRWVVTPTNFFVVGVALAVFGALVATLTSVKVRNVEFGQPAPGLFHDGQYVSNVYAFGPDGKALPEVYLYDQRGIPLSVPFFGCGDLGAGEAGNRFPLPRVSVDGAGVCRETTGIPFTVAIPSTGPAPSSPAPSSAVPPSPAPTSPGPSNPVQPR